MKRRITISLEADLERKLRNKQAALLLKSNHSVSFSEMLNRILKEALKEEGFEVESMPEDKVRDTLMFRVKQQKASSKMISPVQNKTRSKAKNVEIESKLNSIYNRLV